MREKNHLLFVFIFICGLMLIGSGCGTVTNDEDEDESSLEAVLVKLFTGPDEKLVELASDPDNQTVIGQGVENNNEDSNEEETELDEYLKELYEPYFTEEAFEAFKAIYVLDYQLKAETNDVEMKPNSIEIEKVDEENGRYNFTLDVVYENDAESETSEVTGLVNFSGNEITRFEITGDEWREW